MDFNPTPSLNEVATVGTKKWKWNGYAWDRVAGDITAVGTITAGVWQGSTIGVPYGGTGMGSYTAGNYINALDGTTLQQRTPAQVLSDIGAVTAASPTFTGVPLAPTAAVGTNTTQLATTAFVNAEIANDAEALVHGTSSTTGWWVEDVTRYGGGTSTTGALVIQTPWATSGVTRMHVLRVRGYDYTTGCGSWEMILGAYFYGTGLATKLSMQVHGNLPAGVTARHAIDGSGNRCVVIGADATVWQYLRVRVDVMSSFTGATSAELLAGWNTSIVADTSTYTNSVAYPHVQPLPFAQLTSLPTTLAGYGITGVAGTDITSGTIPAARLPAFTGDVTTTVGTAATTIANSAITLAKMANLAANSIIGNNTGSTATPIALTGTQVRTLIAAEPTIAGGTSTQYWTGSKTWYDPFAQDLTISGVTIGRGPTGASTNLRIGAFALSSATSGGGNVAIGTSALTNNTALGSNNLAIGLSAMENNDSRAGCVALGSGALNKMTGTGQPNTAIGANGLFFTTSGGDNVGIGSNVMQTNTTGSANIAMGNNALFNLTTGSNNTAIGHLSGRTTTSANANTTGGNNTWIGYNTGPGTTTQLDYSTVLGSGAVVTSSNTVVLGRTTDVTVIGATADNGSGAKLQVTGNVAASNTVIWSRVNVDTSMVAGRAYTVTGARNMTLPASVPAYALFVVHAEDNTCVILSNGNVIAGVGAGNDLSIAAGETAYLVGTTTGNLEVM